MPQPPHAPPPPAAGDDAEAVRRSLDTPELFAGVYERHASGVHRYAARRLGVAIADDITADTFLTAFRVRVGYDPERGTVRAWLYGIAANLIGRHRRDEVRALRHLARTGTDPVAESWEDRAQARVDALGAQRPLAAALARISPGDRHVLLLIAWADLTYEETAAALGIPLGTVRSRLNRARRKVRVALGADPAFVLDTTEVAR